MKIKGKNILITGAAGFVGANLVRYFLKRGASISIIKRRQSNLWRIKDVIEQISVYNADLLDQEKIYRAVKSIKPEIILHAATYGGHPFQIDSAKIIETNFLGTINLLKACRANAYELFINTGSSSEYGIKSSPIKETDLLEPLGEYGVTKAAAALYCQALAKKEGRPIVTLRLFSPFGYYEESIRLVPAVIISCLNGEAPKVSSPNAVRDFIFIEDVMAAYWKTVENKKDVCGEIINIGYGMQHTVKDVVSAVTTLTGAKLPAQWGIFPNPRVEPRKWQANISKAKKIIKWQPRTDLASGLQKTIGWFKKNNDILYEA